MSRLEANAGFFQIAYEEDFLSLCTAPFGQKVDFLIILDSGIDVAPGINVAPPLLKIFTSRF